MCIRDRHCIKHYAIHRLNNVDEGRVTVIKHKHYTLLLWNTLLNFCIDNKNRFRLFGIKVFCDVKQKEKKR